jgi:hypothetical protein
LNIFLIRVSLNCLLLLVGAGSSRPMQWVVITFGDGTSPLRIISAIGQGLKSGDDAHASFALFNS